MGALLRLILDPSRWRSMICRRSSVGSAVNVIEVITGRLGHSTGVSSITPSRTVAIWVCVSGVIIVAMILPPNAGRICKSCLLYTSDAADEEDSVDLGGRRII